MRTTACPRAGEAAHDRSLLQDSDSQYSYVTSAVFCGGTLQEPTAEDLSGSVKASRAGRTAAAPVARELTVCTGPLRIPSARSLLACT